eukprot:1134494-Pelagomonas_calceolata.AAC.6
MASQVSVSIAMNFATRALTTACSAQRAVRKAWHSAKAVPVYWLRTSHQSCNVWPPLSHSVAPSANQFCTQECTRPRALKWSAEGTT